MLAYTTITNACWNIGQRIPARTVRLYTICWVVQLTFPDTKVDKSHKAEKSLSRRLYHRDWGSTPRYHTWRDEKMKAIPVLPLVLDWIWYQDI